MIVQAERLLPSSAEGEVIRLRLTYDTGEVLIVPLSAEAADALLRRLKEALPKGTKPR
jgi:hypothetical protein